MKILIIGNGGREHAIAWKLAQSEHVSKIYVAPGNGGTAKLTKTSNINIDVQAIAELIHFAKEEHINFTIVGPEISLGLGIVDEFNKHDLLCLGPTKNAAQLETSKTFCKDFLWRHHIPTAKYATFTDSNEAKSYLKNQSFPIVIKADGLAAGKGVIIAQNETEASFAIDAMLIRQNFGAAGSKIVIEEFLQGTEVSFIVLTDGKSIIPFASAQDHKTRDDGDRGPNTGGMGAYSPSPLLTAELEQHIINSIIEPTLIAMTNEGTPYKGFLFAGLMIDKQNNPRVLEFNCRLGDPETQVILPRLENDFALLCYAALTLTLDQHKVTWRTGYSLGIVAAAQGYPETYRTGDMIQGLQDSYQENQHVFLAGAQLENDRTITTGGRVFCAVAIGNTLKEAKNNAYNLITTLHFEGMFYRRDIGDKGIC